MTDCISNFKLGKINIIGGDYKEFPIRIHDDDRGGMMEVTDLKLNFALLDYNQRYEKPIITKDCEIDPSDNKAFLLTLRPEETKDLAGKYIYQLSVRTPNNKQESFQGELIVNKNINPNAFPDKSGTE